MEFSTWGSAPHTPLSIVRNSSTLCFRCFPLKITEITFDFGVIINKNMCKTFVGTKINENMYKICRRGAERRFGAPHRA